MVQNTKKCIFKILYGYLFLAVCFSKKDKTEQLSYGMSMRSNTRRNRSEHRSNSQKVLKLLFDS